MVELVNGVSSPSDSRFLSRALRNGHVPGESRALVIPHRIETEFARKLHPLLEGLRNAIATWRSSLGGDVLHEHRGSDRQVLSKALQSVLQCLENAPEPLPPGPCAEVDELLESYLPLQGVSATQFEGLLNDAVALWAKSRCERSAYYDAWRQTQPAQLRTRLFDLGCNALVGSASPWPAEEEIELKRLALAFLARRALDDAYEPAPEITALAPDLPLPPHGHLVIAAFQLKHSRSRAGHSIEEPLAALERLLSWEGQPRDFRVAGALAVWSANSPTFAAMLEHWGWNYSVDLVSPPTATETKLLDALGSGPWNARRSVRSHVHVGQRGTVPYTLGTPLSCLPPSLRREFRRGKILLLGPAEVGKTTALVAAAQHTQSDASRGARIVPEEQFQELARRMRETVAKRAPSMTASYSTYAFRVETPGTKQAQPFEVLDYRGEDLQPGRPHPELDRWLVEADAIVIFLDPEVLADGEASEKTASERAKWFEHLLNLRRQHRPDEENTPLAIVFSKADLTLGPDSERLTRHDVIGRDVRRELLYLPLDASRRPIHAPAGATPHERLTIALLHDRANNLSMRVRQSLERALRRFEHVFERALSISLRLELFHMTSIPARAGAADPATGLSEALQWCVDQLHDDFLSGASHSTNEEHNELLQRETSLDARLQHYDHAMESAKKLRERIARSRISSGSFLSWIVSPLTSRLRRHRERIAKELEEGALGQLEASYLEAELVPAEREQLKSPELGRERLGTVLDHLRQRRAEVAKVRDDVHDDLVARAARKAARTTCT